MNDGGLRAATTRRSSYGHSLFSILDECKVDLLALMLLLCVAAAFRYETLFNDRTSIDEDLPLIQAHGFETSDPLPQIFRRSQLRIDRSLLGTLARIARAQNYPPITTLLVMSVRDAADPILAARLLLGLIAVAVIPVVFFATRALAGTLTATIASAYVALSSALAVTAQQMKWYAPAVTLATLAGILAHRISVAEHPSRRLWAGYAATLVLLMHVHYFCSWIVVGHAWVFMSVARDKLGRLAVVAAGIAICCLPWYALGLPGQIEFTRVDWDSLAAVDRATRPEGFAIWAAPLTGASGPAALAYSAGAILGFMPSFWRSREVLPFIFIACLLIARALASREVAVRRFALLACCPPAVAMFGQTLYAFALGHVVPLTAFYFVPWMPLVMTTVILGARDLRAGRAAARTFAATAVGLCLVLATVTVVHSHVPRLVEWSQGLCGLRNLAGVLRSLEAKDVAFVFVSESDARRLTLYYRGDALQIVASGPLPRVPDSVRQLILVTPADVALPQSWGGWTPNGAGRNVGRNRLTEFVRINDVAARACRRYEPDELDRNDL